MSSGFVGWIGIILVTGFVLYLGVRQFLIPHAFARRLKLRESFGREPDRSELTRLQAMCFAVAAYSEAHPMILGIGPGPGGGSDGGHGDGGGFHGGGFDGGAGGGDAGGF
jgi:hypothetical protein